ncbi:hypothetical protein F5X96DRAFT_385673 [Biscogniauxia mediterranea]|nr:hypothetical protein F5X96DRAFT_385673 [Biscogniauxia mediterranea]
MSRSSETLAQTTGNQVPPKRKTPSQTMVNYLTSSPELPESLMGGNILTQRDIETRRRQKVAQVATLLDQVRQAGRNSGPH